MKQKTMKFGWIPLALVAALGLSSCGYNTMIAGDEAVKAAWAQVQNQYQRRYDLIPNLVETVKATGKYEKETLQGVVDARSRMGGVINLPPDAVNNPELMKKYQEAQNGLGSALQRLMVVNEQYPQLQGVTAYRDLMAQLEGTENRIAVERMRFNETVQRYNTSVRTFPNNLTAMMFKFQTAVPFAAGEAAKEAPKVKF
ncbi:MAG: LemA family protein [Spirochaetes bacterium]|nr:LemA family protein [Spirochaetota bacterium]